MSGSLRTFYLLQLNVDGKQNSSYAWFLILPAQHVQGHFITATLATATTTTGGVSVQWDSAARQVDGRPWLKSSFSV